MDTENKWIYYEISDKGNAILNPDKNTKISVILSSALTYITAFAALYTYYTIPRLHSKPLSFPIFEDPFFLLFAIGLGAIIIQTIILLFNLQKKNSI
ncbi:hypothetical protein [Methanochimaera problematica]|uniref:hypothetical protein n=1 Tax=Methanochimaera problematica TaxID=2609417 RepID=UPI0029393D0C|nr:hypothetical protein [Methanoplanus sp. FWC-SCC4]